ncbi:NAD(P)-dependent oxidoreductase [Mesobaculum littorinae]|uniref:NAD(P)-dependent oxidoreductase n=1 Tax=Mesobaculum littorinae TaxID=2486419 RepID=A0A438AH27_9RHOB|nr:NAD(P)-dependent oxidoreductase [Mesobaculum littorinae]RVV97887.1 NAD(P)-dependent oxidoreductase [Mesobaculum littorinae]
MKIGFLGYGEAARAFRATLAEHDPGLDFLAWDIALHRQGASEMSRAIEADGVGLTDPAGLGAADWLISAVTADQSLEALTSMTPHLRQGQVVVDINSVSPGRKRDSADLVTGRGARYLDMAVMAPVHPRGHRTPVLCAGPLDGIGDQLDRLDFAWRKAGDDVGQATAIKMCRSLFVKGLEAITVECLLAAEASGCFDEIHASISDSFPGLGWPDFAAYEFERTLRHGARRAAEMRESAATVSELGLNGALASEIAAVQDAMGAADAAPPDRDNLRAGIRAVLNARRKD